MWWKVRRYQRELRSWILENTLWLYSNKTLAWFFSGYGWGVFWVGFYLESAPIVLITMPTLCGLWWFTTVAESLDKANRMLKL